MVYDEEGYQYQSPPKSPIPVAILTSIVTTGVLFFGLRALDERGVLGKPKREEGAVEVPSLLGIRAEQARELLRGRGLLLSLASEKEDSKYPAGTIATQTPLPGSQAPRGSAVQAVISRGIGQSQVPNLTGLRPEDAVRQLTAAGLQSGPQKAIIAPGVTPGMVAHTEPAAGTVMPPGGAVTLVISGVAASKVVPKVIGMRLARARKVLADAGFQTGKVRYTVDEDRMVGVVLRQQPAETTQAPAGSIIDLVVNED
jgi:serine/threonine-protein kinase